MSTILLTIVLFMLVFAALALGLMLGRAPIKGSCGGMAALTAGNCEICGGDPVKCDAANDRAPAAGGRKPDAAVSHFDPRVPR